MRIVLLLFLTSLSCIASNSWQQKTDYKIDVTLNDSLHTLSAFITIDYSNNSPDTLRQIYMHIWANAYKNSKTALAKQLLKNKKTFLYFGDEKYIGQMDSLAFEVNGNQSDWNFLEGYSDIAIIQLKKPLLPGKSIKISSPFTVKLPYNEVSRLGYFGQSFQITQWYPKPAVYDENGWHPMPYLDQGEFYSEFGSFDVKITLPSNYVVGATGDLTEESKLNEAAFINQRMVDSKRRNCVAKNIKKGNYLELFFARKCKALGKIK